MNILGSLMLVFFITRAEVSRGDPGSAGKNAAPVIPTPVAPVKPKGQDTLVHYQCTHSSNSYDITINIKDNDTLNYYAITHERGNFDIKPNKTDTCKQVFANRTGVNTVHLNKCTKDTVYLYIMPKPAYVTFPPSGIINTKAPIIAGGKSFHEYEINCNVQASGTLYNLAKNFNATETGQNGKTKENPDLKLALSINPSSPFIGDMVTLIVTDTTDVKNFLDFFDCSASIPNNNDISSISLIKNGTVVETDIIPTVIPASNKGNSSLVFYAFRFATSPNVMISCTIRACPEQACTATTSAKENSRRRRRRAVNNELNSDSKTVSVTFEVHDKKESSGGMKVGYVSPLLLTAIVFGWMKLL